MKQFLLFGDLKENFLLKLKVGKGKAKKQIFPGILSDLEDTMRNTSSDTLRTRLLGFQQGTLCPDCKGRRLSSYANAVLVKNLSLGEFLGFSAKEAWGFLRSTKENQELFEATPGHFVRCKKELINV